ncbi:unnamed protein product, partial [Polarella glacialis]
AMLVIRMTQPMTTATSTATTTIPPPPPTTTTLANWTMDCSTTAVALLFSPLKCTLQVA